jgi:hypothetical protein
VRSLIVVAGLAGALALPITAARTPPTYPQAWAATQQYLQGATGSCAGQNPRPGGWCTQLTTFTVTMDVLATDRYRIEVANNVPHGNFRYFAYLLPGGMTLQRVLSARNGNCGTNVGIISCIRDLKPRNCSCAQRDLVVEFTASGRAPIRTVAGYWIHFGFVTPYLDQPTSFADLPICDLGEKSSKAHPCLAY